MDAHVFICVIAYHLRRNIQFMLEQQEDRRKWETINPHISQNFVVACPPSGGRAWRELLRGRKLVKRRSSRIDILQSGVLPVRAVAVALSTFGAGIL